MLQRIIPGKNRIDESGAAVRIADAEYPVPFVSQLEFNAPVHGPWNIVHVAMLVPECHQIYVCADNCMRGVVLTAAEMDASDRFSCVLLEEDDLFDGNLENVTIEGVTDAIRRLPYRPRAIALFLVCLHHFVGTDAAYVYHTLEERFPDIDFMRCWMDPVMQKTGLAPEAKLKESMYRPIRPLPVDPKMICVLGDNQPLDPDSDLTADMQEAGFHCVCLQDCKTYEDYLQLGAGALFITRSPSGVHGVTQLAKRLGRPFLYLPPACGTEEIRNELEMLNKALLKEQAQRTQVQEKALNRKTEKKPPNREAEEKAPDREAEEQVPDQEAKKQIQNRAAEKKSPDREAEEQARQALAKAHALIGDTEITLDYFATPRPLSLARLLLQSGFRVTRVYLDAVFPEEKDDFDWLQSNFPDLVLNATIHPKMRVLHEPENAGKMLAIGPKAAWFGGTRHFVNTVDYSGMWGFSGIVKLAAMMEDAYLQEKDTQAIVPRKGFGCACVL